MTAPLFKAVIESQFRAAIDMLGECIERCPEEHWATPVGTLPFWEVAYHALCWTDMYLSPRLSAWRADKGTKNGDTPLHPTGRKEMWNEHPSRRFERAELRRYVQIVREKLDESLSRETAASLKGSSGFRWIKGPRAETYLYNLRHLSHHVGQLSAFLWRQGVATKWVRAGT